MKGACFEPGDFLPEGHRRPITVRRTAAIGDVIAATIVADKLNAVGYGVTFQSSPSIHPILKRVPGLHAVADVQHRPNIDLDGCYENHPERTTKHFSDLFLDAANAQLSNIRLNLGPNVNCRPTLRVDESEKKPFLDWLAYYPKPWVFICPRSQNWANRTITTKVWEEAARLMVGTKFWLGTDAAPRGIEKPTVSNVGELPLWLACADLLVTVDTGPLHIAAAVGTMCVAIEQASSPELHLSDQRDFIVVRHPDLNCLNCQKNLCPIHASHPPCQVYPPELIAEAVNRRLHALTTENITVVIPAHRPQLERLRHCIECVESQVQEIIVTQDAGGILPDGVPRSSKIRYVKHRLGHLGLGRNVNFGARHANGKYLLILNDDVFLRPDAIARLRESMKPGVGIIGHLLYYENGTIQHGGKFRNAGMRGWGHIDHRQRTPTIKFPTECENVTGASILVRRKAFYDAQGFDEEFFLYAEDDAFCLQMLRAGYKVMYTPHAVGTHLEGQTTKHMGSNKLIQEGNRVFGKRWGWWVEKNLHTVPGRF